MSVRLSLHGSAAFWLLGALALAACGKQTVAVSPPTAAAAPSVALPPQATAPPTAQHSAETTAQLKVPLVVFLGDSLAAGLGVEADEAFPAVVTELLQARGCALRTVNAGVSGDTTAGGLSRVDWVLGQKPAVLFVELGANDGLRGQPLESIESNLRQIVRRGKSAGARVFLAGMRIPPSYGPEYSQGFAAIYPRLAEEESISWMPFLLEGVGGDPDLNQGDGIHPTPRGHRRIAERLVPDLASLLGC